MFVHRHTALAALGLAAILAACADAPTVPTTQSPAVRFSTTDGLHLGETAASCDLYRSDYTDSGARIRHKRITVFFPRSELAPDGATRVYRYRGYSKGQHLVAYGDCEIPATEEAIRRMDRLFRVDPAERAASSGSVLQSCDEIGEDGSCIIYITATACQYGGTYPDCNTPVDVDYDSCNALGTDCDGGGGGSYPTGGGGSGDPWSDGGWEDAPSDGTDRPDCLRDEKKACILRPLNVVATSGRSISEWEHVGIKIEQIRENIDYCAEAKQRLRQLYNQGPNAGRFRMWDGVDQDSATGLFVRGQVLGDQLGDFIRFDSYWLWEDGLLVVHEGLHLYLNYHPELLEREGTNLLTSSEAWVKEHQSSCLP